MCPVTENMLAPGDLSVPNPLCHVLPFSMILGILVKVWVLFTVVGIP